MVCQGVTYGDNPPRIAATIEGAIVNDYTADQIRDERLRRKWTQRRFADIIGVSTSAVSAWENGEKTPTYNHMRRINEVFDHGADRDRVAELEADIAELKSSQRELVDELKRLLRESEAYRTEVRALIERLATQAEAGGAAAPQSRPEAER